MSDSDKHSIKLEEEDQCQDGINDQENQFNNPQSNLQMGSQNQNGDGQMGDNGAYLGLGTEPNLAKKRTHRKLQISNFIMKTYKILDDKRNSDIVEWTDEGNCFIVKDKEKFSREILPKYFKHSKFSSFVRQLNMYDFHKIRKQKQIPIFKHRYFKMGCMDLLHKIKRKSGEQGKDDDLMSREFINGSQQIISLSGLQNFASKQTIGGKISQKQQGAQLSVHDEIQVLRKQNNDLRTSIDQICHDINYLELAREKKKQKLVKMITSLIFFDLNQQTTTNSQGSLRKLQQHLINEEEPLNFSQYREKLGQVYSVMKKSLI